MTNPQNPFTLRSAAGLASIAAPLRDAALVVIDAQIEYTTGRLALPHIDGALANIEALLSAARGLGSQVIHVVHEGAPGGLFDPANGGKIISSVQPADDEIVVQKRLPSSFAGTDLAAALARRGNPALILTGFMTHMCVSSTARAALSLGIETAVVGDATATRSLPNPQLGAGDETAAISADQMQAAALAAISDRFAPIVQTAAVLDAATS